jgi:integrase
MAWIEKDRRTGYFKVGFWLADRKIKRSLKTNNRTEAETARGVVDQTLQAIERGWMQLPTGVDIGDFVLSGGRLQKTIVLPQCLDLTSLFDAYFDSLPTGNLEDSTIEGMKVHRRRLEKHFGKSFDVRNLALTDLQNYIENRSRDRGLKGRKVTPVTIKKAIVTLRTVWNWGRQHGLIDKLFPIKGLKYPKAVEKPPFMTFAEVERRAGKVTPAEAAELWECVFLSLGEIEELLSVVRVRARQPFIYPMFVFAAHTGARRSEMVRSKLSDLDFDTGLVTIHERKKAHDKRTTRRVQMSARLQEVLKSWLAEHPGGDYTFCHGLDVPHSRKDRIAIGALSCDEAHDHFKRTLQGTKWDKLRGWHVFRHSFCSNCAAKGIDQRIIDAWVGHLSPEMVRRYRHMLPDQQKSAIDLVFGEPASATDRVDSCSGADSTV